MPYGLENKFNARAQRAMDAYNEGNAKVFARQVKGLDAICVPGLLEYVCTFARAERTMRPANPVAVAFEALLEGTSRAAVRARHDWLRAANADLEVSGAIDAILASNDVDKSALEKALSITERRGYEAASRTLRFRLQHSPA